MIRGHDAWAVDHVDALHEGDVLPDLCLAGNGRDDAHFLLSERVDDGGFARVGVADHADGDLLAIGVQGGELTEEGDEGAFAEGVVDVGVESWNRVSCVYIGMGLWYSPSVGNSFPRCRTQAAFQDVSLHRSNSYKVEFKDEGMCEILLREPPPICSLRAETDLNSNKSLCNSSDQQPKRKPV